MGLLSLAIATACYMVAAVDLAQRKDAPMALVFAAYSVANLGLIYASYRGVIITAIRSWL